MNLKNTQLLVKKLLQEANHYEWSLQGFGMLRLYLSKGVRLHIWHSAFRVPGVSDIHDHPWDFSSDVVCGNIINRQYIVESATIQPTHMMRRIRCGPGGGVCESEAPVPVSLWRHFEHVVRPGSGYVQRHYEIHASHPEDGTVTLITRGFREDTEHANVFYPLDTEWVSAEPRPATTSEVGVFVKAALVRLEE